MERRKWAPFPDSRGGGPSVQAAWLEGRLALLSFSGWPLGGSLSPLCSLPSQLPTHLDFSGERQGTQPFSNLPPEALPCAGDGAHVHTEAHKEFPWLPGVSGLPREGTERPWGRGGGTSTRSSQKWQEAGNIFGDYCGQGTPVDIYQLLVVKHSLSTLALLEERPAF